MPVSLWHSRIQLKNPNEQSRINALYPPELDAAAIEQLQPYQLRPKNGTREATENMIDRIDGKIAQLATLGLRPHPIMVGYRRELVEQLETGGPYKLRVTSGVF
jgi:hypothetical protein